MVASDGTGQPGARTLADRGGWARGGAVPAVVGGLRRRARIEKGEREILELIARGAPLAESLAAIVRLVEAQGGGMLGSILQVDEHGRVHVGAAPSLPAAFNAAVEDEPIGPRAGSCGTSAFTRQTVITPDIATDPRWADYREVALASGLASSWSTPLFAPDGRVVGTLAQYYLTPQDPRPRDLRLIEVARHLAEIAIERARTDAALRCARLEAERLVEARTAELRRLNADLERRVADRTRLLEEANRELEAFSYSVSHDLRAPLRTIEGFTDIVLADHAAGLAPEARGLLGRVTEASRHMAQLIEDMLMLSRMTRGELRWAPVDLTALAHAIADQLRAASPGRILTFEIEPGLATFGDARLLRVALENLLANAVKFTGKHASARIAVGRADTPGGPAFFVRDDGAGFDMAYAGALFKPFARLHAADEFEGTGIGLATVQRVINRHRGRVWAEGAEERGATFWFTLGDPPGEGEDGP